MPKPSVDQALRQARGFARCGKPAEAERICREILERFPANQRVLAELQALSAPQAADHPPPPEADAVIALYYQGRFAEGADMAEGLVARYPRSEITHNIAAAFHTALGHLERSVACCDRALELAPDCVEAHNNRGNALKGLRRFDDAIASFDRALRLKPDYAQAYVNRGIALHDLGRLDEALASYDAGIRLKGDIAEAYNNRGNTLRNLGRHQDALADYDRAIRLKPNYAEAHINRGNALRSLKRPGEAIASYGKSVEIAPRAEALNNCGAVLKDLKRLDEALACFEAALRIKPDYTLALSESLSLRARMCLWEPTGHADALLRGGPESAAIPPFAMLAVADDPERQLACAKAWVRERYPHSRPYPPGHAPHRKIRIGYFSADFHNHATMYLMARLFELHDKSRFDIHAFSYGAEARDAMRERLLNAVDAFHDVADLDDRAVADLARSKSIDIAVDLKGYTENTRTGIFCQRAAPIQVGYLGYPGTMGAEFIDYVIGDAVTIPEEARRFYTEAVAYLPNSYQVNDNRRPVSETVFRRADLGLPERGFVFCCFNNTYKISPAEFDIWMRLLARVDGSVLWLLGDNPWAVANLRREAEARGIAADRLVFAERMEAADHLARQRCADLFLDTFKVNAHTTASDALWVGLPVLTKLGASFAGRVAASLLHAVGLPELVADSEAAYERLALELATRPDRLAAVKTKLAVDSSTLPLFDTETYARDIEALFAQLYAGLFPSA